MSSAIKPLKFDQKQDLKIYYHHIYTKIRQVKVKHFIGIYIIQIIIFNTKQDKINIYHIIYHFGA